MSPATTSSFLTVSWRLLDTRILFGMLAVALSIGMADADDHARISNACAQMDHELTWLIEEHGANADVRDELLVQAAFQREAARDDCLNGREAQGLAIYDNASRSITEGSLVGWTSGSKR